jgi:hypothetical protein
VIGVMNEFNFLATESRRRREDDDPIQLALWLAQTPCGPLYKRHISPDRELAAAVAAWSAECRLSSGSRPQTWASRRPNTNVSAPLWRAGGAYLVAARDGSRPTATAVLIDSRRARDRCELPDSWARPRRLWSASGRRVVRETTKTNTRQRKLMSLETPCATSEIGRLASQGRDARNPRSSITRKKSAVRIRQRHR